MNREPERCGKKCAQMLTYYGKKSSFLFTYVSLLKSSFSPKYCEIII